MEGQHVQTFQRDSASYGAFVSGAFGGTVNLNASLPAGVVCGIRVTANSGNAVGYLMDSSIMFDNPSYVTWTYPNVPIARTDPPWNLADYLPTVGSTCNLSLSYTDNSGGARPLSYPNVGTVIVSDPPHAELVAEFLPPHTRMLGNIHFYGPPTPEQEAMYADQYSIYLNFEETMPPKISTKTKTVTFYLKRLADYNSYAFYIITYHPW